MSLAASAAPGPGAATAGPWQLSGAAAAAAVLAPGLSNVSNPAMQQNEDRLLTFVNWPSRIPVRPDQLAKAGFYYVGKKPRPLTLNRGLNGELNVWPENKSFR